MVDGSASKPALRQDTGFWGLCLSNTDMVQKVFQYRKTIVGMWQFAPIPPRGGNQGFNPTPPVGGNKELDPT